MKRIARLGGGRLIAWILAIGLFQQISVLPILHTLHWANSSAAARSAHSDSGVDSLGGRSEAPARHDANACPICATVAQYRAGAVAPTSVWQAPPELSSPVVASAGTSACAAERLVSAARAPPSLSA